MNTKVEDYFYNQGLLKGAHFTADFKMLETPKLDWNDIVIKSEDRQVLDRNLVKFIDSVDLYRRKGLRGSRGVLLAGPPVKL